MSAGTPDDRRIVGSTEAWHGKYVRIENTAYLSRSGAERQYETVRRNTFGDIVAVLAITTEYHVVLVRSFRVPHGRRVIELPAGLADKQGEDAAALATRELLEETGYGDGTPPRLLLRGPIDPGLTDDIMAYYFTSGVRRIAEPALEEGEDIETFIVPMQNIESFVAEHQPECDVKLLAPFAMARHLRLLPR